MHMVTKCGVMMLALAFGLSARADDKPKDKDDKPKDKQVSENDFLVQAIASNVAEVKMAERALKASKNDEVRKFALKMIADHTKNRELLMDIAKQEKVAVVEGLEKERQAKMDQLNKLEGEEFDREYMRLMVDEHEKALKLYEDGAKSAKNDKLRDIATKTATSVKSHMEEARKVLDGLKK